MPNVERTGGEGTRDIGHAGLSPTRGGEVYAACSAVVGYGADVVAPT